MEIVTKYTSQDFKGNDEDKQLSVFDALQAEKVEFIQDCMAIALSKQTTIKKFLEHFGGSRTQAYRYYNTAIWEIQDEIAKDRAYHVARTISRLDRVVKMAISTNNPNTVILAEKFRAEMLGLLGPVINEPGAVNGIAAGRTDALDVESARDLAKTIARTQAAIDVGEHDALGPEQLQNG